MSPTEEPRVFIVDDDEAVRDSLAILVETRGLAVKTFSSGNEFMESLSPTWTGCVFIDVRMPGIDGLEVQRQLVASKSTLNVVIMTAHGDVPMAVKAMKAGAVDFLEKPIEPQQLLETLQRHINVRPSGAQNSEQANEARPRFDKLTAREKEVLTFLVKGAPNKVIAFEMGISPRTVELHRAHVMQKMAASSLSHLVRMALAIGVNPP